MEYTVQNDALYFFKNFTDAKEGTHQYKFRLGPGDWWVLDENAPTGKAVYGIWAICPELTGSRST